MAQLNLEPVAVLGLGRFGRALCEAMTEVGCEVLGVDRDPELVQSIAPHITLAVQADVSRPEALEQLGLGEYNRAVVAIGTSVESSILCASNLIDLGVPEIWAKAVNAQQARILTRLGIHNVVFPELDMGYRVANALSGHGGEVVPTADGFGYAGLPVPRELVGRALGDPGPFFSEGIRVLGVTRGGRGLAELAVPEFVLQPGDRLIVAGPLTAVERLLR